MKYLRKFESVSDMETTIQSSEINILGLAYRNGNPVIRVPISTQTFDLLCTYTTIVDQEQVRILYEDSPAY